jgi:hypothetical protein
MGARSLEKAREFGGRTYKFAAVVEYGRGPCVVARYTGSRVIESWNCKTGLSQWTAELPAPVTSLLRTTGDEDTDGEVVAVGTMAVGTLAPGEFEGSVVRFEATGQEVGQRTNLAGGVTVMRATKAGGAVLGTRRGEVAWMRPDGQIRSVDGELVQLRGAICALAVAPGDKAVVSTHPPRMLLLSIVVPVNSGGCAGGWLSKRRGRQGGCRRAVSREHRPARRRYLLPGPQPRGRSGGCWHGKQHGGANRGRWQHKWPADQDRWARPRPCLW